MNEIIRHKPKNELNYQREVNLSFGQAWTYIQYLYDMSLTTKEIDLWVQAILIKK